MAALDLLGRRGALRILWELREGRRLTFRALASTAELNPATLNARLKELRELGLVVADGGYGLSDIGQGLLAALAPLTAWSCRWAERLARHPSEHMPD